MENKILVVDDEEPMRRILKYNLERMSYQVEVAGNGVEALKKLETFLPDLIVLDVLMPEMDGWQVAAQLKNSSDTQHIPILMLTIVSDKDRGLGLGIDEYLIKPFSMEEFIAKVCNLLERKDG